MPAEPEWLALNRGLWDELAAIHPHTDLYDVDGFVAGRDDLRPWEDQELGPVAGLDLVHLQCHIGTDTLGWARRGARTTGVDFSAAALDVAAQLAGRCGLEAEWVLADVYGAPDVLGGRTFDVVYTGIGAIGWLPDLDRWAEVVRTLLRPDGVLYVVEIHPMWVAHWSDGETICQPAIDAPYTRWVEEERTSYADSTRHLAHTTSYERLHSIADVLSAVLSAGLVLELFHEFDATPAPTPWLRRCEDGLYRFPPGKHRFPLTYSLRARRVT